ILAAGSTEEISRRFTADTVIDLHGKTVMPGFIDAHAHINGLGELLRSIVLVNVSSGDEIVRLVEEKIKQARPGEWIYGRGWDQNLWDVKEFPDASLLDEVSPENPVVLIRVDGHVSWVNSKAMAIAGVTSQTRDPEGGRIIRDGRGNPTGIFMDNARNLVENFIPPFTEEEIEQNILRAADECAKIGLTEVGDMGMDSIHIAIYQRLADERKLPVRIYGAISDTGSAWREWSKREPLIGYGNGMFTARAVKVYMDGALGSRGAALVEEYSDDPGNRGITQRSDSELESTIRLAFEKGYQACIHAIGDRGNHIVLNAYEKVLKSVPKKDYRPRIEHVQVLLQEDIPRFKQLEVLPSMEPVHCTSDMFWAEARLGPDRIKGAYAWKSLLNTGTIIVGGSDFPNDGMNPLWGFYAAITRSDRTGYPQDGWKREERMTREEAARCFTQWAAYGSFEEHVKGTIEPGKWADLTILSKDIMQKPPKYILTTEDEMKIVGGNIVYQKNSTNHSQ
ncbi:MAG: amidohydrolase, partial [Ignavibacteriales bacterium]|nr:amidohydrolase [Ignavibacteriales bacterium]